MENIGLQDSLLSRFDLLFILLDTIDVDNDKKISDHVVNIHQYRSSQEVEGAVSNPDIHGAIDELDTNRGANSAKKRGDDANIWDKSKYLQIKGGAKDRYESFLKFNFFIQRVIPQLQSSIMGKLCLIFMPYFLPL